jgi:hypothetical protein
VKGHGRKSLLKRNIGDTVAMEEEPKAAAACMRLVAKKYFTLISFGPSLLNIRSDTHEKSNKNFLCTWNTNSPKIIKMSHGPNYLLLDIIHMTN